MAREAVVEGQASWLMLEVGRGETAELLPIRGRRGNFSTMPPMRSRAQYPVFNNAPLYL